VSGTGGRGGGRVGQVHKVGPVSTAHLCGVSLIIPSRPSPSSHPPPQSHLKKSQSFLKLPPLTMGGSAMYLSCVWQRAGTAVLWDPVKDPEVGGGAAGCCLAVTCAT
jgi:hypothetical protein